MTLDGATQLGERPVVLMSAEFVDEKTTLDQAFAGLKKSPILLVRSPVGTGVIGILTAFDLL